jgi:hypothetical protein
MTLGIALILIFVLYLIDKHNKWQQAVKITVALVILSVLGIGGLIGWQEYETWQSARQEVSREAAEAKQVGLKQVELAKTCKDWEDKHPIGSPLDKQNGWFKVNGEPEEFVLAPPQGCEGPLETAYANVEAADAEAKRCDPKKDPYIKFGGRLTGCPSLPRPTHVASLNGEHALWENHAQPPINPSPPPDHETFNSVYITYFPDDWETARLTCTLHIKNTSGNPDMSCLPDSGLPNSPKFTYFTSNIVLDKDTMLQKADYLAFHSEMDLRLGCASKRENDGDLHCTSPHMRKK